MGGVSTPSHLLTVGCCRLLTQTNRSFRWLPSLLPAQEWMGPVPCPEAHNFCSSPSLTLLVARTLADLDQSVDGHPFTLVSLSVKWVWHAVRVDQITNTHAGLGVELSQPSAG